MRSKAELPCLVGVFPPRTTAGLMPRGEWRAGEFRSIECAEGTLLLIGQCPIDDESARREFAAAIRAGEPARLTRWSGSYLLLVLIENELLAFSDLVGQHPLYYHHDGAGVVFGTSLLATAAEASLPLEPDVEVALAEIFCSNVPALLPGRTPIKEIRRLEPGQALRATATGELFCWTYEELTPDEGQTLADCAESLATELDEAVGWRMRAHPRVSADFSGGLDSTTVAFLAVNHRAEGLPVFVYHHPDADAGDLAHALSNARLNPLLDLNVVRGSADSLAYQDLGAIGLTDVPDFAVAVHGRNQLRLRHAAASGSAVHLGGGGADALLVAPPAYLGELASKRQIRRLMADARALSAVREESQAAIVGRAMRLARTPVHKALRTYATQLGTSRASHPKWIDAISWWPGPGLESTWLTPRARSTLVALVQQRADATEYADHGGAADFLAAQELRRSADVQHRLDSLAREHGIWPQAPFLDSNVARACMRMPARLRAHGATLKPLLREAMRERVPVAAITRSSKGDYGAEDHLGVRRAVRELRCRLSSSPLVELGLIEPAAVISSLHLAMMGDPTPFPALNRLIAYDMWLRWIR
jgi:asparagine synthase (glutamine-hydrolysing)